MLLDFLTLVVRLVMSGILVATIVGLSILLFFWWSDYLHERRLRKAEREFIDVVE